jgi:CCR4-NOT transcription complex subunit 3
MNTIAEIERVMKKVDEGVELFDEIWEKVYSAEQQNQKEKYEMDLKKEIKKLQRLRDQIKTWIGSSEIKDKEPLIEARKLIETKMEQFKICEKETKTKTYSKEGLARQNRLDPGEEAKLNTTTWLGEYIERIVEQTEEKDFEIERLSSGKGKKTNKHQIEQLQQHIANHKFHISKLEGIIRLVNNDVLDAETVDQIKDDLDYYLESYQEEEYMQAYDEEYIYETLGLDDLDIVNVDRVTIIEPTKKNDDTASSSSKGSSNKKASKQSTVASVIPMTIGRARTIKENEELKVKEAEKETEKEELKHSPTPQKAARSASTSSSQSSNSAAAPSAPPNRVPASSPPPAHSAGTSMATILKRETEQQEKERQRVCMHSLHRDDWFYSRWNCVLTHVSSF